MASFLLLFLSPPCLVSANESLDVHHRVDAHVAKAFSCMDAAAITHPRYTEPSTQALREAGALLVGSGDLVGAATCFELVLARPTTHLSAVLHADDHVHLA